MGDAQVDAHTGGAPRPTDLNEESWDAPEGERHRHLKIISSGLGIAALRTERD